MARIKYSALVSDMRNKLNGSVLSVNRAGSYIRNKVTPVNPQTSYQQAVRQLLGSLSSQWRSLSEAARLSWIAASKSFPYTDIFGDQKFLDGKSLFIKLNSNLSNAGAAALTSAPLPAGVPTLAITGLTVTPTDNVIDQEMFIGIADQTVPTGTTLMLYATPPINPGQSFVKNRYRFIGTATALSGTVDIANIYSNRFAYPGAAEEGKTIHVRAAYLNNATGEMGVPVSASTVLAVV